MRALQSEVRKHRGGDANLDGRRWSRGCTAFEDTCGDTAVASAAFQFCDVESVKASLDPADSVAGALLRRGSKTRTREQIARRLGALRTEGGITGELQSANIGLPSHVTSMCPTRWRSLPTCCAIPHSSMPKLEQPRQQAIIRSEAVRKEPGTRTAQAIGELFDIRTQASHCLSRPRLSAIGRYYRTLTKALQPR